MDNKLKVAIVAVLGATLPKYETIGAAGMDLTANLKTPNEHDPNLFESYDLMLFPGDRKLIPTGLKMQIPEGYEAQIRPRSGLANKHGITVINTPGTIDSDYRGEVGVLLINHGDQLFNISDGDRIGQIVFNKVERVEWEPVESLEQTTRGEGGFGSTGTNSKSNDDEDRTVGEMIGFEEDGKMARSVEDISQIGQVESNE